MDTSLFLAKVVGILMTVIGIAIVKSPERFQDIVKEYTSGKVGLYEEYIGAVMALIMGLVIVLFHNVWTLGWPVIITLFGWLSLVKGAALLLFAEETHRYYEWLLAKLNFRALGAIYALIGLFLAWKGFF